MFQMCDLIKKKGFLFVIVALFCISIPLVFSAEQYGRETPSPVEPYLNGVFPMTTPSDPTGVEWEVVNAFPNVTFDQTLVISPNPSDNHLYVGSRDGNIISFENRSDITLAEVETFLDLRDRVAVVWDGGFLGLVFHPEYGNSGSPYRGHVYVYYSSHCPLNAEGTGIVPPDQCVSYPTNSTNGFFGTYLRLSRFLVPDGETVADPDSEEVMLNIRLYNGSHRGGGPTFGDDGYMYLAIGDQFRYETAQDIRDTLEGGVMRLEVNITDNGDGTWFCPADSHLPRKVFDTTDEISGRLYCIPESNPWQDSTGTDFEEYFSIGHRNPHRLSKDPVTGRIWSGEIGQSSREEINVIAIGNNYGWPFREGTIAGPRAEPSSYLGILTEPVIDFTRDEARAIIGGYVYRGTKFAELDGRYLAGDYVTNNLWAIDLDEATMTASKVLLTTFPPGALGTWGQDNDGEVYLGDVAGTDPLFTLGRVGSSVPDPPQRLSDLGAFDNLADLTPAPFFVPYNLIQPFWSDNALKQRWIALPNDGVHDSPDEKITFSEMADWEYPKGTVLMKHFELPLDETNPNVKTRLETRYLVKGDDLRWYGVTYRWLPDQSDAVLLTGAETQSYSITTAGGGTREQTWYFPSRGDCMACHNSDAGALGPRTHQLNNSQYYPLSGATDNQLRTWNHLGMFDVDIDETAIPGMMRSQSMNDAGASLEDRARSYFDSNCSYCHRPGTGNRGQFDARLTTPLTNQGLIYGGVADNFGLPDAAVITPGDPTSSIAFLRMDRLGTQAMPPLAKNVIDDDAVDLMEEWILRIDPGYPRSGLSYEYYEITGLSNLPEFDTLTAAATGGVSTFDISVRQRSDNFAFRFTGVIYIAESGDYTFFTNSDDGSQLFINGALVVDNDGLHPPAEASGIINLSQGYHDIVVTMFERGGGEVLDASWQGPGFGKQLIPAGVVFREIPTPIANTPPTLDDPGDQLNSELNNVSVILTAGDADGDSLFYSADGLPPGLTVDGNIGEIAGQLPIGSGNHAYMVTVGVSDGPDVASATFTWNVTPYSGAAQLSASLTEFPLPPADIVDLTIQGTADWTHWGASSPGSLNRKSGVPEQISDYTLIGSSPVNRFTDARVVYVWSDGDPSASSGGTTTGIYFQGIGNGYQLTVPADDTLATLRLYLGAWRARGRVEVSLSDSSAPPFVDVIDNPGGIIDRVLTVTFSAAGGGQTLDIQYILEDNYGTAGNITL